MIDIKAIWRRASVSSQLSPSLASPTTGCLCPPSICDATHPRSPGTGLYRDCAPTSRLLAGSRASKLSSMCLGRIVTATQLR